MSVPTDPALLAQYTSGQITYAEYTATVKAREQAAHTAAAIAALKRAKTVSPTLISSEIALQKASLARQQQQAAREAEARRQQAARNAALRAQQAKVDAARRRQAAARVAAREAARRAQQAAVEAQLRAKTDAARRQAAAHAAALKAQQAKANAARRAKEAAAAARAQAELRKQQQAAAAASTAAINAEQARRHAEQQRVSQLAEQARQKMIAETGRVLAPEQQGRVIAEAMTKATAEQDIAAGNYNGISVYLVNKPAPEYKPIEDVETGIPYVGAAPVSRGMVEVDRGRGTVIVGSRPAPVEDVVKQPYVDQVPVTDTAVQSPAAHTPTVATDLGAPSAAWNDAADTSYAPVVGVEQHTSPAPAQNPYLYMTHQQQSAKAVGQHVGVGLLIGAISMVLTGVWIQT